LEDAKKDLLEGYEERARKLCRKGGHSVVDTAKTAECPDGYYLVRWKDDPYQLEEDAAVEGCGDMPAGTWVCRGQYLNRMDRCTNWYEYVHTATKFLFRLQYVLLPKCRLKMYDPKDPELQPPTMAGLTNYQQNSAKLNLHRVPTSSQKLIRQEQNTRQKLDSVEVEWIEEAEAPDAQEEEDQLIHIDDEGEEAEDAGDMQNYMDVDEGEEAGSDSDEE
jgi:hypothetical protein